MPRPLPGAEGELRLRALVGLQGTRLRLGERERLRRFAVPGVLLLRHNVTSTEQVRALCAEVHEVVGQTLGQDALIVVDEEGGAVSPLAPAIGTSMSAAGCGRVGDPEYTRRVHQWRASRTCELGIGMLLAPVGDVDRPGNPVIATRAFGRSAGEVMDHVEAAIRGLREGGVRSCLKHWPGHGAALVDSHYELPLLQIDRAEWESADLPVFERSLGKHARAVPDAVMIGHVVVPFLDESPRPATVSRRVVHEWLRERWGFDGMVFSDALEMGAFHGHGPELALDAGCDLVLLATPLERLRTEVTDVLTRPREDDAAARRRLAALLATPAPARVPADLDADWDPRCLRGAVASRGRPPSCWVLVDAASHDRLLRPPEGVDSLRFEDPSVPVSLLGPEFEADWGAPAAEVLLANREDVPGAVLDGIEAECCVVASVRPLGPRLEEWLLGWLGDRPRCRVVLLGAAALESETGLLGRLRDREVLLCTELHGAARRAVARA